MAGFASSQLFIFAGLISVALCGSRVLLNGDYILKWTVADGNLTVTSTVKTLGWVGFGISESGSMANSDLVLAGRRSDNGAGYLLDAHAASNTRPTVDANQNVELLLATENATHTTVIFTRKLDTGDNEDKPVLDQQQHILCALGQKDGNDMADFDYHTNKGSVQINLIADA